MARPKRKDKTRTVLRTGELQRSDGSYQYSWTDENHKRRYVYSKTLEAKKAEHKKSSVRAKVEHVFAVVKRLFGYRKTRYRGLRKQTAKLNIMFALANLYPADRKSLTA